MSPLEAALISAVVLGSVGYWYGIKRGEHAADETLEDVHKLLVDVISSDGERGAPESTGEPGRVVAPSVSSSGAHPTEDS